MLEHLDMGMKLEKMNWHQQSQTMYLNIRWRNTVENNQAGNTQVQEVKELQGERTRVT